MSSGPGIDNILGGLAPSLFFVYTFMQWGNSLLQGCPSSEGLFFCATPGAAHRARRELARPQGSQGRKHHYHIKKRKAARPELSSSQACAYIKRSRAQAYKTRKGASSKKKNKQGRKLSLYIQGGKGRRGGAIPNPISIVLSSVLLVVLLSV